MPKRASEVAKARVCPSDAGAHGGMLHAVWEEMRSRLLVLAPFVLLVLNSGRNAQACGAVPEPINYFTFGVSLTQGRGRRARRPDLGGGQRPRHRRKPAGASFLQREAAQLHDANGNGVALVSATGSLWDGPVPKRSFIPVVLLQANTPYHFESRIATQLVARPAEAIR